MKPNLGRLAGLPKRNRKRPGSRLSEHEGWTIVRAVNEGASVVDIAAALDTKPSILYAALGCWALTWLEVRK